MKRLLLTTVAALSLLTACQARDTAEVGEEGNALQQEEGGRVLLSNKRNTNSMYRLGSDTSDMRYATTNMGYSRRQKNDSADRDRNHVAYIDRESLANIITDLEIKMPDVTDAATMVTDDEVFVVYRANTTNPKLTQDQVRRTALSVVPRYYHVYTSTEQKLMTQMEGLKSGRMNNTEFAQTIDMLKREMSTQPHLNNQHDDSMQNTIKK
jgi:hypothetical protein